ncbi:MAG TPA: helicase-related protein [Solirubrobacterales bacterium]|nr:helicase-related protein [Solirubrobacterales bacterium]
MSATDRRPDVKEILGQLKDFQQATVERVFNRFYGPDPTRRFLLADEVGLGKTLVAKGVIARALDHLWDEVERIDVIYICSNADIARQNLNRLHPDGDGFTLPSRITLLPLKIEDLKGRKMNFVSFTPGTSLEPRSAMGIAEERALLLRMLREPWEMGDRRGPRKVFQGTTRTIESFESTLAEVERSPLSEELTLAFQTAIDGRDDLRGRYEEVLEHYGRSRDPFSLPDEVKDSRRELIGELRHVLAQTCVKALEPDLVLLDEFQRFRHLLSGDDETAELARELFDWRDEETGAQARVLLMSATPYKMFTVHGEAADDHYEDFVATLTFLAGAERAAYVGELLSGFRRELLSLDPADHGHLLKIHAEVQRELQRVMVRTERLGAGGDRDGMLKTVSEQAGVVTEGDIADYLKGQQVARAVGEPDVMEYWKSAPYLLNLLGDDYKVMRRVKDALETVPGRRAMSAILPSARLLSPEDVRRWAEIDAGNPRMRGLVDSTVGSGAWKLLWMPPSLPYYESEGPFSDFAPGELTKKLVFSSWKVVPRAIASIVSYAAERELWRAAGSGALNTERVRKSGQGRLVFGGGEDERLTGMPVLAMLYPSTTVAALCDPLTFAAERSGGDPGSIAELRSWASERVAAPLAEVTAGAPRDGPEDAAWYWAAALLIDRRSADDEAHNWLERADAVAAWSGEFKDRGESSHWADHVERAQQAAAGDLKLGPPPADLAAVVAELGLFGWGNTARRALGRVADHAADASLLRTAAARIGWSLRTLFNLPEVHAFVPCLAPRGAYWQQCLEYTAIGGLQSVLDEYAHLLVEALGHSKGTSRALEDIAERISSALTLRAGRVVADEIRCDPERDSVEFHPLRLRSRFAARFGDQEDDEGSETTHADALRASFNSPFWPFVLASTSIGQEGLDFHHYCHAVVHWNLPSNPVDLEQREGRIHRFKNHAVRKNLALRYGLDEVAMGGDHDPWADLFEAGRRDRPAGETDLVPYWLYPLAEGAVIRRHVPILPLSQEVERFEALRRSLAVYRLAFGQSRQEDLVAYLLEQFSEEEVAELIDRFRIDLSPPLDGAAFPAPSR